MISDSPDPLPKKIALQHMEVRISTNTHSSRSFWMFCQFRFKKSCDDKVRMRGANSVT